MLSPYNLLSVHQGNVTLQSSVLRQVQELLLDIICYDLKNFDLRETVGLNISNVAPQFDSSSFVDNFVAFCRLQHLDINASIKEQVRFFFQASYSAGFSRKCDHVLLGNA